MKTKTPSQELPEPQPPQNRSSETLLWHCRQLRNIAQRLRDSSVLWRVHNEQCISSTSSKDSPSSATWLMKLDGSFAQ